MFVRVFEYTVASGNEAAFEAAYGPLGDWAQLFGEADGYLLTTLESDGRGSYRTQDLWSSRKHFETFLDGNRAGYDALGLRLSWLKASERHLGDLDQALPATRSWWRRID